MSIFSSEFLTAWQELDRAAMAVQVAQPRHMTICAEQLETARKRLYEVVQSALRPRREDD